MRNLRNLALIGFMGTGKSVVGHLVAEALQFEFIDTDKLVEAQCGVTVEKIFQEQGEPSFRKMEQEAVSGLEQKANLVIATGGGVGADSVNMASLKSHALVVCLWASPESIWERVQGQTHRPLLRTSDPLAKIRELLANREASYRQADVLVQTNQRSPKEVAQQILLQFQSARR